LRVIILIKQGQAHKMAQPTRTVGATLLIPVEFSSLVLIFAAHVFTFTEVGSIIETQDGEPFDRFRQTHKHNYSAFHIHRPIALLSLNAAIQA
jgi:hypothetical protein